MEKACRAFMDSYFQVSENTRKLFCRTIRKSYKYYLSVHPFKCWIGYFEYLRSLTLNMYVCVHKVTWDCAKWFLKRLFRGFSLRREVGGDKRLKSGQFWPQLSSQDLSRALNASPRSFFNVWAPAKEIWKPCALAEKLCGLCHGSLTSHFFSLCSSWETCLTVLYPPIIKNWSCKSFLKSFLV